jgi:hypothetical protein
MKIKKTTVLKVISVCIILYAITLKTAPEFLPFSQKTEVDDFYAPHAGYCVPELEF